MKLCRNCRTINEDTATACVRCKMRDQLVDYNPEITREWQNSMRDQNNVEEPRDVCRNCGTTDYGHSTKCIKCHFPLEKKGSATYNDPKLHNK